MIQIEIINEFAEGKLKENDIFEFITNNKTCNPCKVQLKVGYNGDSLTESWLDSRGKIIRNNWTVWKDNIASKGSYIKI